MSGRASGNQGGTAGYRIFVPEAWICLGDFVFIPIRCVKECMTDEKDKTDRHHAS